MVHIKFVARPKNLVFSPEFESMVSNKSLEISA
jgi:hypothetical protein